MSLNTTPLLFVTNELSQLLVLDPEKRIALVDVERHPWIVKHCVKGERAYNRESGDKCQRTSE